MDDKQFLRPLQSKSSDTKTIVIIVVFAIVIWITSIFVFSYLVSILFPRGEYQFPLFTKLSTPSPIAVGNSTSIVIKKMSDVTEANDVVWYVLNDKGITIAGGIPLGPPNVTVANRGVNVTWFDNDYDNKLSEYDTLIIGAEWIDILEGYKFRLEYAPLGIPLAVTTFK